MMTLNYKGHNASNLLEVTFSHLVSRDDLRKAIQIFEARLLSLESAQTDIPSYHHFAPGTYAREMHIPPNVYIVGKLHRHAHLNIISKGSIWVVTEHEGVQKLKAPCTFVSTEGTKRVVLAETDTVWTTIHPTELTDLTEIEKHVIADSYEDLELGGTI